MLAAIPVSDSSTQHSNFSKFLRRSTDRMELIGHFQRTDPCRDKACPFSGVTSWTGYVVEFGGKGAGRRGPEHGGKSVHYLVVLHGGHGRVHALVHAGRLHAQETCREKEDRKKNKQKTHQQQNKNHTHTHKNKKPRAPITSSVTSKTMPEGPTTGKFDSWN